MRDQPPPGSSWGRLVAVLLLVALLGASLWLVRRLGSAGALQDCVATGRHDCAA